MLFKLLKKTLLTTQLIAYGLGLFIGVFLILITLQLYFDLSPFFKDSTSVLEKNSVVISKNISLLNNLNSDKTYFNTDEIDDLSNQDFIKDIAVFKSAKYKIKAFNNKTKFFPVYYSDLFFESIPKEYVDINSDYWLWNIEDSFIPIIVPENYLNLYNFGFAQSQGLPVLSKKALSKIEFNINIRGNGKSKDFKARIVDFSKKINTILVPETFMDWSNNLYGSTSLDETTRLMLTFNNPSDENILKYINKNNLNVEGDGLEFSKFNFIFQTSIMIIIIISFIIISLSITLVFLSLNFMLQKNKFTILNLIYIGYNKHSIIKFYFLCTMFITIFSTALSFYLANYSREYYIEKFNDFFYIESNNNLTIITISLASLLLMTYYLKLNRSLNKIILNRF
jgi:hypothetical protein